MVKFNIEQVRSIMETASNIRNISVIAHVDHGKSSLVDLLLAAAGMISMEDAGSVRATDNRPDEKARGITIKSTGVTLYFEMPKQSKLPGDAHGREFVMNLIDSPGHVDFSSEVTAALRVTDGGLVLVDMVEGVCVQTETVLRQALTESVVPVLVINKVDRGFMELKWDPEEIYQSFVKVIENANVVISTYQNENMGNVFLAPEKGNVAFSSAIQGWSFSLNKFARFYSEKFGRPADKIIEKLWGDNFYDPETKKWSTRNVSASGKPLQRGFCKFILEPIGSIFKACEDGDHDFLKKCLPGMGVALASEEWSYPYKKLLKTIMQRWLPAEESLLEMIVQHLPSPAKAQRYRCENLYTGPMDDVTAEAIRNCDPKGPLVMYVSKLVPVDNTRFYAFGRVFSGTINSSAPVRILGPNYKPGGSKENYFIKNIQRVVVMMGKKIETVDSVPCGNTCALVGIDKFILKSATITSDESSWPIVPMKFSVSPVVEMMVEPKNPSDLPKLVEGMKRLMNGDSLVQVKTDDIGNYIVAGAGELHLEICLNDLVEYMGGVEIKVSPPIVTFNETVTQESSQVCLAKSANKHNRFFVRSEPLGEELVKAMEAGKISADPKIRTRQLVEEFDWDPNDAKKLWAFGPTTNPINVLDDMTRGIDLLHEAKDSIVAGFQWAAKQGVLCDESLRGVRFNLLDAVLHSDRAHRGGGQVIPATRRAFYASQLTAKPKLVEPVYMVEISCPQSCMGGVYSVMSKRRGKIIEETPRGGTPLTTVKCHLPVLESIGFNSELREATGGMAFPLCFFDHWSIIPGDPFEKGSKAEELVLSIRKRKGLQLELPSLENYHDKL